MVKNDRWIQEMAKKGMIEPFRTCQIKKEVISYGVGSYGYDMRVADDFRIYTAVNNTLVDPKNMSAESFISRKGDFCVVPPQSFVLGRSVEYFRIPRDVLVLCFGKSTYARCGLVVNVTPLEPEWEGYVTISISNTGPLPAKVYSNEGIGQLVFIQAAERCRKSYPDKKGRYQAQKKITLSR